MVYVHISYQDSENIMKTTRWGTGSYFWCRDHISMAHNLLLPAVWKPDPGLLLDSMDSLLAWLTCLLALEWRRDVRRCTTIASFGTFYPEL